MGMRGIGAAGSVVRTAPEGAAAHARTVAQSFQSALPSLFNDGEKALAAELTQRPPQIVGQRGDSRRGSVKLSYAVKDEATAVALANLFLNAVLDVAFSPVGTWGIPLATSLVNIAGAAALFVLLRRKIGRVDFTEVSRTFIRVFAASALAGAAAFAVWAPIDSASGRSLSGQLASVLPALAVAVAVYFAACLALQVREMQTLLSLRGRLRRA